MPGQAQLHVTIPESRHDQYRHRNGKALTEHTLWCAGVPITFAITVTATAGPGFVLGRTGMLTPSTRPLLLLTSGACRNTLNCTDVHCRAYLAAMRMCSEMLLRLWLQEQLHSLECGSICIAPNLHNHGKWLPCFHVMWQQACTLP